VTKENFELFYLQFFPRISLNSPFCSKIEYQVFCPIGHHLNNKLSMPKESNDEKYRLRPKLSQLSFQIEARLQGR